MAASVPDKIKALASALEIARRAVNGVDEDFAEIAQSRTQRDSLREENTAAQRELDLLREEVTRAAAAHADWQRQSGQAQEQIREETERLRQEQRAVEAQLKETRAQSENALAGLRALSLRITGSE